MAVDAIIFRGSLCICWENFVNLRHFRSEFTFNSNRLLRPESILRPDSFPLTYKPRMDSGS